ncbi:MAG: HD domain-containing protein [Chloroflexi bacterium]|nr:HD domain-containing protein [Chloroflexota bacterium]
MGQLRVQAQIYVWFIILSGIVLLALVLPAVITRPSETLIAMIVMALFIAIADRNYILLRPPVYVTVSTAIGFAVVLLFGPAIAAWTVTIGSTAADISQRKPWYKITFNVSNLVLAAILSGLVFTRLADGTNSPVNSLQNVVAWILSAGIFILVNSISMASLVSLIEGHNVWHVWLANHEGLIIQFSTLPTLGALIAVIYLVNPFAVVLVLLPVVALYFSFKVYRQLQDQTKKTIELLADAVDKRDAQTFQHSFRVAFYAENLANKMGLSLKEVETITSAARIHDLGKIGIQDETLMHAGPLDGEKWATMREHPSIGASIVAGLALYEEGRELIQYHHERFDGTGYPRGLKGDEIPQGARIISVADAFDAMLSDRIYRRALSYQTAISEIRNGAGTQFDPEVVEAFISLLEESDALALPRIQNVTLVSS